MTQQMRTLVFTVQVEWRVDTDEFGVRGEPALFGSFDLDGTYDGFMDALAAGDRMARRRGFTQFRVHVRTHWWGRDGAHGGFAYCPLCG